ncbi:hypothetical protein Taro_050842, partial [Colocasia esculenta]|nr:hypothetical protein [Colocasia esculenta]
SLDSFSMLPFPVWYVCGLWAAPGWSIPWVCLSAGVSTAVHVATPEEASARVCCCDALPRRDRVAVVVPFPIAMDLLVGNAAGCLAAFSDRRVTLYVPTGGLPRFWLVRVCLGWPTALLSVQVVSIAWDPHPQKPLREHSGLRACSSWRTLELRGKRGLDSGAESFVELSWLVWDAEAS